MADAGRVNEVFQGFLGQPRGDGFLGQARGDSSPGQPRGDGFLGQPRGDAELVALAATQHGVFSLDQVRPLGLTASALQYRTARARLHRIHRGVYSLVPCELLTRRGHWMAAVLACGPRAVLSHRTAAALHGLRPTARAKIDVTLPTRSAREHHGIDIHRPTSLTAADITTVENIPCTTVARTLLDLAEVVPRRQLERAFDQSEIQGVFDLTAIQDQLTRNSRRSATAVVRSLLAEHYPGTTATQSELEEAFLAVSRRYRLPDPRVNEWIDLGDGELPIWADFVWHRQRVIVETDGRRYHDTQQARQRDPRRDQRLLLAAWQPVRTTWRQVTQRSDELGRTLVKLLTLTR